MILPAGIAFAGFVWYFTTRPPSFPSYADAHNLAVKTAEFLEGGTWIADCHAYYCGMGLACIKGVFIYDAVQDGHLSGPGEFHHDHPERKEFADKGEFVAWLERHLMSLPLEARSDICFTRVRKAIGA